MTESAIIERLDSLTAAVQLLAQVSGARLTRAELAARLATAGYNTERSGAERSVLNEMLCRERRKEMKWMTRT